MRKPIRLGRGAAELSSIQLMWNVKRNSTLRQCTELSSHFQMPELLDFKSLDKIRP